jgi:hypothetical protein
MDWMRDGSRLQVVWMRHTTECLATAGQAVCDQDQPYSNHFLAYTPTAYVCITLPVQTVQALLPPTASSEGSSSSSDKLQQEALQWGQQQGMSVRSAATFARCYGG